MGNLINRVPKKANLVVASKTEMKEEQSEEKPSKLKKFTVKRASTETSDCPDIISPRSAISGRYCSKKIRKSGRSLVLTAEREEVPHKSSKNIVELKNKQEYLKCFLALFDDEVIQDFMWSDGCAKLVDKYLLAMVYVYFRRADLSTRHYHRTNFFAALFLAHDMEEDDEEIKQEIFPWALGRRWKSTYPSLIARRDDMLQKMNFRSVVSNVTCLEVFDLCPDHPLWQRERQSHHGGASRLYPPDDEMPYNPKGPGRSPTFCTQCTLQIYHEITTKELTVAPQRSSPASFSSRVSSKSRFQQDNASKVFDREE